MRGRPAITRDRAYELASLIKIEIGRLGWTRAQLAAESGVNANRVRQALGPYAAGKHRPTLIALARHLGIEP